jgi:hypothetical protein
VHTSHDANRDRNDPEGLHVCYSRNNTWFAHVQDFLAVGGNPMLV